MAIHAITGVMGSGKSHEAVKEKICVVLKNDDTRRVVTNIEGLNVEKIAEYVDKPVENIKSRLIIVPYERVAQPKFWYDPEGGVTDSLVQPGDEVTIDEVWRYFNKGAQLPVDAMRFMRMHRHYSDENTGHTCDLVLINQALRGIHQDIRDVIEVQFQCRKLKVLGRPQNYEVSVIEGGERKASHTFIRKYDPKIFPLYSSYAHNNAKEIVDKRQSVFSKSFFKIILPLAAIGIIGGSWFTYSYFKNMGKSPNSTSSSTSSSPTTSSAQPSNSSSSGTQPAPSNSSSNSSWRVVATYKVNGVTVATVVDEKGRYRSFMPGSFSSGSINEIYVSIPADPPQTVATPWTNSAGTYTKGATNGAK